MGSRRMFSLAALLAVGLASAGSPCTTAAPYVPPAPAPPPYVPPASPCSTAPPIPPKDCSSFACPANYLPKPGVIMCGNIGRGNCDSAVCCALVTTVTTTPMVTVTTTPGTTVTTTPGTTVTTTPPPTCAIFTCPEGFSANEGSTVCQMGHCDLATCCAVIFTTVTTTPPTTVITTPATTVTTTPYVPPPSTPGSPCTTAAPYVPPAPVPTPSSPCTTAAPPFRKYDAKEAALVQQAAAPKKESSTVSAAAVPLFGVVAMFTFVAFVSTRARGQRSTREVLQVHDEEAFMGDVSAAE